MSMKGLDETVKMGMFPELEYDLMVGCIGDDADIDCSFWLCQKQARHGGRVLLT